MEAHLQMWLSLLLRWTHFIVGIAWIGASFYFNWLENHLQRLQQPKGIAGNLWAVHGGGFYHLKKYAVTPSELPPDLHWFKWEAYATWASGLALLVVVFYLNAPVYMLDSEHSNITAGMSIGIGLGSLLVSWVFYDLLCRSPLARHEWLLALLVLTWFTLLAWILTHFLSDRAVFIHVGAAIGTAMAANVWRVIIPGQKDLVKALIENRTPQTSKSKNALQRSRHNNYFTLPVLFIMLSAHYPATYSHPHNWLILLCFSLAAVAIRHYFNIRHLPGFMAWPLIPALLLLVGLILATAPKPRPVPEAGIAMPAADIEQAYAIIKQRCINCHTAQPDFAPFTSAPMGVELDSPEKLANHAERVYQTVVIARSMPLGNLTGITDAERDQIADWYQGL